MCQKPGSPSEASLPNWSWTIAKLLIYSDHFIFLTAFLIFYSVNSFPPHSLHISPFCLLSIFLPSHNPAIFLVFYLHYRKCSVLSFTFILLKQTSTTFHQIHILVKLKKNKRQEAGRPFNIYNNLKLQPIITGWLWIQSTCNSTWETCLT